MRKPLAIAGLGLAVALACGAGLAVSSFGVPISGSSEQVVTAKDTTISTMDVSTSTPAVGDCITVGDLYYTVTATGASPEVSVGYFTSGFNCSAPTDDFKGGTLVLPSQVTYQGVEYAVTAVTRYAFYKVTTITSVEIPSSVKSIGVYAFDRCWGVQTLTLHEGLETIEENGLAMGTDDGKSSLKELVVPSTVTSIGSGAFRNLRYLEKLTISDGDAPLTIAGAAFAASSSSVAYNKVLSSLEVPARVTAIGGAAFAYNTGLTSVVFHCDTTGMRYKQGTSSSYNATAWFYRLSAANATILFERGEVPQYWDTSLKGYCRCSFYGSKEQAQAGTSPLGSADIAYGTMCLSMAEAPASVQVLSGSVPSLPTGNYNSWRYASANSERIIQAGALYPANVDSSSIESATVLSNGSQIQSSYDYHSFNEASFLASLQVYNYNSVLLTKDVDYSLELQRSGTLGTVTLKVKGAGAYSSELSIEFSILISEFSAVDASGHMVNYTVTTQPGSDRVGAVYVGDGTGCAYQDGWNQAAEVSIPDTVVESLAGESYSFRVEGISAYAFKGFGQLSSVSFGENIAQIGSEAFNGCSALTSLDLPDGLERIGDHAFYGCSGLTELQLPGSLVALGKTYVQSSASGSYAFGNCTNLRSVAFGKPGDGGSAAIATNVFSGCTKLSTVAFNGNVGVVGTYAFSKMTSIESVTGWEGVTSVENLAFYNCGNLVNLDDAPGVLRLGSGSIQLNVGAFAGCSKLTKAIFGPGITVGNEDRMAGGTGILQDTSVNQVEFIGEWTEIPTGLFRACGSLTQIEIPNGVTSVDRACFSNCTGLKTIYLPASTTYIGQNCFNGCTALENVVFRGTCKELSFGTSAFFHCSALKEFEVPAGTTTLPSGLFAGCSSLEKVVLPQGLTTISDSCFGTYTYTVGMNSTSTTDGCTKLRDIDIPASVTTLGESAFEGCTVLPNVMEALGVTSIGESCFAGCTSLERLITGPQLEQIGSEAFRGCSSLAAFGASALTDDVIELPSSVTSLGTHAFYGCSAAVEADIEANVSPLPRYLFSQCSSLAKAHVGEGVSVLNKGIFQDCKSLEEVEVSSNLTSIGEICFSGCSHLASFAAPASLNAIGISAFDGCQRLSWIDLTACNATSLQVGEGAFNTTSSRTDVIVMAPAPATLDAGSGSVLSIAVNEDARYEGTPVEGVTVLRAGQPATDAAVEYQDNEAPGTATATVTLGTFSKTVAFQIGKAQLTADMCSLSATDVVYTGKACEPAVTVEGLSSSAYTVTYASNTKIGTAKATVTPVQGVEGSAVKLPFTISAKKGATYTSGALTFQALTAPKGKAGTLTICAVKQSAKKVVVPAAVSIGGVSFKVTAVAAKAFKGCSKMKNLTLGSNVKTIGKQAFAGCKSLSAMVLMAKTAPTCGAKALSGLSKLKVVGCKAAPAKVKKALSKGGLPARVNVVSV